MHVRWIALALAWMPWGALAQTAPEVPADKSVLACLEKGGPKIDYPARDRQLETPGFLRVSLRFSAPDRRPEVSVLFRAASDEMLEEVQWHVRGYRLPCLPRGQSVTAVQEFQFRPRETAPITWTAPRALPAASGTPATQQHLQSCIRTPKTQPDLWGPARQKDVVNVIVEMSFAEAEREPDLKVLYASASETQVQTVKDYARRYRLGCSPTAEPFVIQQQFTYRPAHAEAWVFKEALGLKDFLSHMKGIRQARADFDFKTMNCPFQVAWTLGKPAVDNRVGEVGAPDPNRTEFLAWLGALEIDLSGQPFEQVLGQTVLVNVPCGTLRLAPGA